MNSAGELEGGREGGSVALLPALQNEPYTGRKETKGLARAVGACTVLRLLTAGAMMFRQAAGACIV